MTQTKRGWLFAVSLTSILILATLVFSSYQTRKLGDDVWKMLGISRQTGTDEIKNSFLNGYLSYYSARNAKNIALNDRAAIAKDLLAYTKEYISSPAFKKQYEDLRKGAKPEEPVAKPLRTIAEIQKEEIAKTEKSIKDMEKNMKEMTADMKKAMQPVLEMLQKNLKDYQDPKNEYFASLVLGEKYQQEDAAKRYTDYMKRWETDYPESLNLFVAGKLKKMLEYTAGIDYNAELVMKYNKKRFVNPTYEGKRTEWKQGFRAGKDVTEMARTFAQQWLTELK